MASWRRVAASGLRRPTPSTVDPETADSAHRPADEDNVRAVT